MCNYQKNEILELKEDYEEKSRSIKLVRQQIRETDDLDRLDKLETKLERLKKERREISEKIKYLSNERAVVKQEFSPDELCSIDLESLCNEFLRWMAPEELGLNTASFFVEGGHKDFYPQLTRRLELELAAPSRFSSATRTVDIDFIELPIPSSGVFDLQTTLAHFAKVAHLDHPDVTWVDVVKEFAAMAKSYKLFIIVVHRVLLIHSVNEFINNFWKPLLSLAEDDSVSLVLLLLKYQNVANKELETVIFRNSDTGQYCSDLLIPLPEVDRFTKDDIVLWFRNRVNTKLSNTQYQTYANQIITESDGKPWEVYSLLQYYRANGHL